MIPSQLNNSLKESIATIQNLLENQLKELRKNDIIYTTYCDKVFKLLPAFYLCKKNNISLEEILNEDYSNHVKDVIKNMIMFSELIYFMSSSQNTDIFNIKFTKSNIIPYIKEELNNIVPF